MLPRSSLGTSASTCVALSRRSRTSYGVKTVRVDAGGALIGALVRRGLVNEVSVVVEPRLVGGESHRWLMRAPDVGPSDAVALKLRGLERLDDDALWLRYDVVPR